MMQSIYALDNNYTNRVNNINTPRNQQHVPLSSSTNTPINDPMYTPCDSARFPVQGPPINSGEAGKNFQNINTNQNIIKTAIYYNKKFNIPKNGISGKTVLASRSKPNYGAYNSNKTHKWVHNQNKIPRVHPNDHRCIASKNKYNNGDSINTPYDYTPYDFTKLPGQTPPINSKIHNNNKTHKWVHNQNNVPRIYPNKTHKWVYNQNKIPRVDEQNQIIINTTIYYNKNFNIPDVDISGGGVIAPRHKWVHDQHNIPYTKHIHDVTTEPLTVAGDEMVTSCENKNKNNNDNNKTEAPTLNTNSKNKTNTIWKNIGKSAKNKLELAENNLNKLKTMINKEKNDQLNKK